jgi:RimJ/RimL family protein N-acetyltransferase
MSVLIETERLYLRQWKSSDEDPYITMNMDKDVMEFFPSILTAEQSRDHIKRMMEQIDQNGYGLFAVEKKDDHSFIGFTGFSNPKFEAWFTPCTEIGWRINKKYWNKGFATEAAKACMAKGLKDFGLTEIYSWTSVHNTRSEKVMQKTGMEKVGEFDHPLLADGHYLQKHVLYRS